MPSFTLEQVKEHSRPDDVWIVLHNKVYDITKYLEDHPGGAAVLVEVAGTDATEAFEEIGHSDEAREALEPYYVGDLPNEEHAEEVEIYRPNFEQVSQSAVINTQRPSSTWATILRTALKLGLGGAVGTVALTAYRQGWTAHQLLHAIRSSISLPRLHLSQASSSSQFWSGAGIATVAQLSLTIGVGMWATTKLDVQQEFTHYAPRRPASSARIMRLPRRTTLTKAPKPAVPVLDPRAWRPFALTSKVEVAPHVFRLIFALPNSTDVLGLPTGQHVALRATINGAAVSRSYTPVSNNTDLGRIELLIKVYPNGLMTNHLANMKIGETIDMRGPKGAMKYSHSYARKIGMIAGGTGITPMYQLIRAICEDDDDTTTQIVLLYANNTEADILLRDELEGFARKCPNKFQMQYVLSQPDETWTGYRGFVSSEMIEKHIGRGQQENKVLLCGPPPMIGAMKKSLAGLGWTMPGAVAKATDQVFLF